MYEIDKACTIVKYKDRIILVNREEGKWFNLHENVYNNLCWYMNNNTVIDSQLKEIFDNLYQNKIIVNTDNYRKILENITVMFTNKCNLSCKHCCASEIQERKDINEETILKIVKLNPRQLTITGGEALLHSGIKDMIPIIREKYSGLLVLASNGILIKNEMNMIKKYIDIVEISLDGINEEGVERYRGKGVYHKVIDNVKELREHGIKVSLSMVVHKADDIEKFRALNEKYGTIPVLRELHVNKRVLEYIDRLISGGLAEFTKIKKEEIEQSQIELRTCGMIQYQIFVDSEGYAYPCGGLAENRFCIGNLNDEHFMEKYRVEVYRYYDKIVNMLLEDDIFARCRDCIVRAFCWTCMSELVSVSRVKDIFDYYCKIKYEKCYDIVFNNKQ